VETNETAYIRLQQHLDRQPVGFPATRSGAEIKVLKHIFTPEEAEIAACLSYRPEPPEAIYRRAAHLAASPEALVQVLDRILRKGGIESRTVNGVRCFCNAPLVVGMFELQLGRLTPEFLRDFDEYTRDKAFGIEFLSTALPQMRTIPIARSLRPQHNVATFDAVSALLQQAEAPFVILECICRKKKALAGTPCKVTDRRETCLAMGDVGRSVLETGGGKEIAREAALAIIDRNQRQGLVLQPSNTRKADFICSCCGCCCGMLSMHRSLPRPLDFWSANFRATVDAAACDACGACEKRCQVGALRVADDRPAAEVDPDRCIGCGLCVAACPTAALSLVKKSAEIRPPESRDALYDIIMAQKKGRLGKLKLTGKLFFDAIRTGRAHRLK
jgi:electron transport complex protein RnfB